MGYQKITFSSKIPAGYFYKNEDDDIIKLRVGNKFFGGVRVLDDGKLGGSKIVSFFEIKLYDERGSIKMSDGFDYECGVCGGVGFVHTPFLNDDELRALGIGRSIDLALFDFGVFRGLEIGVLRGRVFELGLWGSCLLEFGECLEGMGLCGGGELFGFDCLLCGGFGRVGFESVKVGFDGKICEGVVRRSDGGVVDFGV